MSALLAFWGLWLLATVSTKQKCSIMFYTNTCTPSREYGDGGGKKTFCRIKNSFEKLDAKVFEKRSLSTLLSSCPNAPNNPQ